MLPIIALILGIVEGLTEYLPVSSTGHLILTEAALHRVFGVSGEGSSSFDIVIQLGAVLAVVVHYRVLLKGHLKGLFKKDPTSVTLLISLLAAFAPTAVAGLLLRKTIKRLLFGPLPVAMALIVGGILMVAVEQIRKNQRVVGLVGLEHVTPRRAFLIGLGQCVSLCPGSSRSMCTILAGQFTGISTATAAEFSFLLALPTLGAATAYEAFKGRHELAAAGFTNVAIGFLVSFLVAWAVISVFLRYLQRRGLMPFGYYRVVVGAAVILLWTRGWFAT